MRETAEELPVGPDDAASASLVPLGLVVMGRHGMRAVPLQVGSELVIGRDESCQLTLPEPALSRRHALLVVHDASVTVEDLGSRHGTWFDGRRIDSALLGVGASVRLADVVVTVSLVPYLRELSWQADASEFRRPDARTEPSAPGQTLRSRIASLERTEAMRALTQTGGNQRRAAELLGIPLRTLERRLRAWRAEDADGRCEAQLPGPDEPRPG
jgi:pSer/pThr/pTyr-binding forkhead associated (FHA) protein